MTCVSGSSYTMKAVRFTPKNASRGGLWPT